MSNRPQFEGRAPSLRTSPTALAPALGLGFGLLLGSLACRGPILSDQARAQDSLASAVDPEAEEADVVEAPTVEGPFEVAPAASGSPDREIEVADLTQQVPVEELESSAAEPGSRPLDEVAPASHAPAALPSLTALSGPESSAPIRSLSLDDAPPQPPRKLEEQEQEGEEPEQRPEEDPQLAAGAPQVPAATESAVPADADATGSVADATVEASEEAELLEAEAVEATSRLAPEETAIEDSLELLANDTQEDMAEEPLEYSFDLSPAKAARLEVGTLDAFQEKAGSYELQNTGTGEVQWSASTGAEWLGIRPTKGSLAAGEAIDVAFSADYLAAETAGPGQHAALITFETRWMDEEGEEQKLSETRRVDLLVRSSSPLAIQLPYVADFSAQLPFRNLFLQASAWIPQDTDGETWNTGAALDLDPQGWVRSLESGQAAGVVIARGIGGRYPGGSYVLEYQGKGVLEAGLDARVVGARPGRLELAVTPSDAGIYLKLVDTDPEDPLRTIRLTPAAWEDQMQREPFHPDFLETLRPFGVLRFASWQRVHDSPLEKWGQRPRPMDATQTGPGGVAAEVMIMLCNELHLDPWFCIPHQADDEFVRRFANTVRDYLDPDLDVYVEYSSEVWNPAFGQHAYLVQQGLEKGLSEDPFEAGLRAYTDRSLEIFRTWRAVLGKDSGRVVGVLSVQADQLQVARTILAQGEAREQADALAVAPWFGKRLGQPANQEIVASMGVQQLLDAVAAEAQRGLMELSEHAVLAQRVGLDLIAYEGGQHLVGEFGAEENAELAELFQEANRHPRMGQIYGDFLRGWRQLGGGLFTLYQLVEQPSKWGSWGLLEFQDQAPSEAPKYQAATSFAFENPRWWAERDAAERAPK